MIKVKYIGEDAPLSLRTGKVYDAALSQLGWYGIVDETGEAYVYPPELFEIQPGGDMAEVRDVVKAHINWTPHEFGGRRTMLPVNERSCPIMVFEPTRYNGFDPLLTAEIYNESMNGRTSVAYVSYLLKDAPHHLLRDGGRFMLYEGKREVARGAVARQAIIENDMREHEEQIAVALM
jgi:hypothetical protein